jgi:hypothetical protein
MDSTTPRRLAILVPVIGLAAGCGGGSGEVTASAPRPQATAPSSDPATTPAEAEAGAEADVMTAFADLLAAVVTRDGLVRYETLEQDEPRATLQRIVRHYAESDLPDSTDGKLAFWCNAYNVNILEKVLRERARPEFDSVIEVPGFFDRDTIAVAGETLTLNDLENKRIRPLGDARIHAVLVCAAMSCPPLRSRPFDVNRLDEQLDGQCRRWVNDPTKFRIVDGRLGLSEILKWYGEDFEEPPFGGPVGFVLAYADPQSELVRFIARSGAPATTWIEYDWALNDASTADQPDAGEPG